MDIKILGCFGGALPGHFTTNFVVNGSVAIDAGALAFCLPFEEQCKIRHVFITHTHLDHTASLPFLVDNVFGFVDSPIHVRSIEPVIWSLRNHLFNNHTWPDFSVIPDPETSIMKFHVIEPNTPVCVDGLKLTAVPVNHTVPCVGYLIDDGKSAVLFTSDTGPCPSVYEFANSVPNLKALITEVSFPDDQQEVADISKHLTPRDFAKEVARLKDGVRVLLYHLKPPWIERLHDEIAALKLPHVECLHQNDTYSF